MSTARKSMIDIPANITANISNITIHLITPPHLRSFLESFSFDIL